MQLRRLQLRHTLVLRKRNIYRKFLMQSTMQLLQRALELHTASELARRIGVARQTFTNAKAVGNLSPAVAGAVADELGEDTMGWVAIAALEAERDSACKARVVRAAQKWRRLSDSTRQPRAPSLFEA